MLLSVVVFFVLLWLLGYPLALGVKFSSREERVAMTFGLGLAVFPLLSVMLNWLSVPLHILTYVTLGVVSSVLVWWRMPQRHKEERELVPAMMALLLALVVVVVFSFGAFRYAYLEDDDPWFHAMGVKYVAEHWTYSLDPAHWIRSYLEPYPPSYDVLMGVLRQTNDSVQGTLKLFNVFLVGFAHLFFFFFARAVLQRTSYALFASVVLVVAPGFAGHFIWAQSLNIALMFPALLSVIKGWPWYVTTLLFAGVGLSQLSSAVAIYGMAFLLAAIGKKWQQIACLGLAGVIALSVFYVPMIEKYGWDRFKEGNSIFGETFSGGAESDTSGSFVYGWRDFVDVPLVTRIDQPTGFGSVIVFLAVAGLAVLLWRRSKVTPWWLSVVAVLLFTLAGLEGNTLPMKLFPHRFWPFLAVPVALLCAVSLVVVPAKMRVWVAFAAIIALVVTAGYPKFVVQTTPWQPGGLWASKNELLGYLQLKDVLPRNTPILMLCTDRDEVVGLDFDSLPFDPDVLSLRRQFVNLTSQSLSEFMKRKQMEHVIIDNHCVKQHGKEKTGALLSAVRNSTAFMVKFETSGMHLYKRA
ncbi:hypothetical protein HY490_01145 [Candidatus Woesearchaeota archaeon]|nr:hypothetical protein [Candidatus Woesearchaeota archaeon]